MARKLYPFILALFCSISLFGESLAPEVNSSLINHMLEVNEEWSHQVVPKGMLLAPWQFANDDERIMMHLMLVESYLRARPVKHLTKQQQENRLHQLDVLQEYWQSGQFPRNTYHEVRQPYFVDNKGTACAVGYLALQSGEENLVAQISKEQNFAYVREINSPELLEWAEKNGLTVDELAWIQPGYPPASRPFESIGNGIGVEGHVNKMVKSADGEILYIGGAFTAVDGESAGSVIAWNGTNWQSLGNGVVGEIYDMEFWNNHLYVVGDFYLADEPTSQNVAYFDGNAWVGLQEGNMGGKVYTLQSQGTSRLYIGGDFLRLNGETMPYLARYENNAWSNSTNVFINGSYQPISGAMSVNAPVHCLEFINNKLLVGGDFTQTAPGIDIEEINPLENVNYLAYWDNNTWAGGLYGNHPPVRSMGFYEGDLYIGSEGEGEFQELNLSVLRAGLWETAYGFSTYEYEHSVIKDFFPLDGNILVLGQFFYSPFVGITGTGAALFNPEYLGAEGFANFNGAVNTAIEFKGKLIFGGDFDAVNTESYAGIVQLSTTVNAISDPGPLLNIKAFMQYEQLVIRYNELPETGTLRLFSISGQPLEQVQLGGTSGETQVDMGQFPAGTYVYQVQSGGRYQAGKVIKP